MDRAAVDRAVRTERLGLADLLAGLPAADWERPSLCEGWTVREVAAHLTAGTRATVGAVVREMVRARGDFNRMIRETARRDAAARSTDQLVAELRAAADSRRRAPGTSPVEPLLDLLVHGQDIAVPLGVPRRMPVPAARVAAVRIWEMGFPFGARRRLRGLRLVASDTDLELGGPGLPEVRGPVAALLMLLAGRRATLAALTGPGAGQVAERLGD